MTESVMDEHDDAAGGIGPIRAAVAEALDMEVQSIDADTDLLATGRMDSVAMVTLLSVMEERFDISVPLEKIVPESFQSVRSLSKLIADSRQAQ